ncbi:MAG: VOC family protein [Gammaproteobacteria bacterium]|nr:VOC family protein [Gammaproteobacteria bacterium]
MRNQLDHLVFCATTLKEGIDHIGEALGVKVPSAGIHTQMGTHNAVMQLGNNIYFEIIAINPESDAPQRPRWFSMDNASDRLAIHSKPRLITWVANTEDLKQLTNLSTYPYPEGLSMTRETKNGLLEWSITVAEDGTLPAAGLLPTLIQWKQPSLHPSNKMIDLGCRLASLTG